MNTRRRLEKLEQTMKPPPAPFPVVQVDNGFYVQIIDREAFYRLALSWLISGKMVWLPKGQDFGFGGGPNNHSVTKEDYAQFANVGYALEGIVEEYIPAEHIPQDTAGMIALLERSL